MSEGLNLLLIDPLVTEHRLIERMTKLLDKELCKARENGKIDLSFLDITIDLLRTYADRRHHGKEEGVFLRSCQKENVRRAQQAYAKSD